MIPKLTSGRIALALLIVAGCGAPVLNYDYRNEPDPRGREHVLGVADKVRVTVWRHQELSGTFTIPSHGAISLPLIGDIVARGKTPTALRTEIQTKLADYLKGDAAKASVRLAEVNSYRFTVSGEVARANLFSPKSYVTVTEAIALAGGFSRFADRNRMYILRDTHGKGFKKIPIHYDSIVSGRRADMNIVILTGDVIHVP